MVSVTLVSVLILTTAMTVSTQGGINVLNMFPEFKTLNDRVIALESKKPYYIAFLDDNKAFSGSEVIVFDQVKSNVGNGYNPSNGVFTAPQDGVYIFGCVMVAALENKDFYYSIYKNNVIVSYGYVAPSTRYNSNTQHIIMWVRKGEIVLFRHRTDYAHTLHGDLHSYFFGYKLY